MNNIFKKVKETLLVPPTYVLKIPYNVNNYNEVLEIWREYKEENKLRLEERELKEILKFHKTNDNHIILYHSKNDENCILLCKINNIYYNIIMPIENENKYDLQSESFLATYLVSVY